MGVPVERLEMISYDLAQQMCQEGEAYITHAEKTAPPRSTFIRAVFLLSAVDGGRISLQLQRECVCSIHERGALLRSWLLCRQADLESRRGVTCWLTLQLAANTHSGGEEDGEVDGVVLQHAFFEVIAGHDTPSNYSLFLGDTALTEIAAWAEPTPTRRDGSMGPSDADVSRRYGPAAGVVMRPLQPAQLDTPRGRQDRGRLRHSACTSPFRAELWQKADSFIMASRRGSLQHPLDANRRYSWKDEIQQ